MHVVKCDNMKPRLSAPIHPSRVRHMPCRVQRQRPVLRTLLILMAHGTQSINNLIVEVEDSPIPFPLSPWTLNLGPGLGLGFRTWI